MDEEQKKNHFNIGKMTEEFRKRSAIHESFDADSVILWDFRFKLAIAQQLSVISAHLGELVELCKSVSEKK